MRAAMRAAARDTSVAKENQITALINVRLSAVLREATEEMGIASAENWWKWWYEDNECLPPTKAQRVVYQSTYVTNSLPSQTPVIETEMPSLPRSGCECLLAGTPVWTEAGPVAVEKVLVGDRVFACDPETGCLALKPVLRTTVRPPTELLKLHVAGEVIECTTGHVFWVSGKGWLKARQLRPGMNLRTIRATAEIDRIEIGQVQPAYNLVVDAFHTYFAGKGKFLTHDNTIRKPTNRIVPGLVMVE
jgi:hypothetical protein